jgi:tight adherence protein B
MLRRLLPVLLAAAVLAPAVHAAEPGSYQLRRVDTAAYPTIHLVVRSAPGAAVPAVYENGARVTLLQTENLGRSKALVLAIDRSQSMRSAALARAGQAADWLLQHKRPADEVAVVTFASTAVAQTGFSQATIDGDSALRTLSTDPIQGTALYDAIVLSTRELEHQPLAGRVLVLLTDGHDVGSSSSFADALRTARRAGVVVYTIALGNADDTVLRRLAAGTGGVFFTSPTSTSLTAVYERIAGELDRTWRLSYVTSARPGDRVSIAVGRVSAAGSAHASVALPGRASVPYRPWLPHLFSTSVGALVVALAAGLVLLAIGLVAASQPRSARIKRLILQHTDPAVSRPRTRSRSLPAWRTLLTTVDRRFRTLPQWSRVQRLAERAGLGVPAASVIAAGAALAFVLSLLAALAASSSFVILVVFALGLGAPFAVLELVAARRLRAFDNQLPDVLATMASSLRAGYGLRAALQTVVDEGAPPVSVELRRVLAEARLGRPLEEALISMCERLGWSDLLYVATAVEVQSQIGGSLAGVLGTVADTVRRRQQHRRRVRSLTATGRSSAIVLAILPFVFAGLLTVLDPNYMLPFLRSHAGHVLTVVCVISIGIGGLLLNRIVNIKA